MWKKTIRMVLVAILAGSFVFTAAKAQTSDNPSFEQLERLARELSEEELGNLPKEQLEAMPADIIFQRGTIPGLADVPFLNTRPDCQSI